MTQTQRIMFEFCAKHQCTMDELRELLMGVYHAAMTPEPTVVEPAPTANGPALEAWKFPGKVEMHEAVEAVGHERAMEMQRPDEDERYT